LSVELLADDDEFADWPACRKLRKVAAATERQKTPGARRRRRLSGGNLSQQAAHLHNSQAMRHAIDHHCDIARLHHAQDLKSDREDLAGPARSDLGQSVLSGQRRQR
jgi:hypothetical protein